MTSSAANSLNIATSANNARYRGARSLKSRCSAIVAASVSLDSVVSIFSLSKDFRVQTRSASHRLCDTGKSAQRQVSALRIHRWARGGINLHEGDLRSRHRQFLQPLSILLDVLLTRRTTVHRRKQTLNHHGPPSSVQQDIGQDFLNRHFGLVHKIHVRLRPDIQLGPNLIVTSKKAQTILHLRRIQIRSVCNENDFEEWPA